MGARTHPKGDFCRLQALRESAVSRGDNATGCYGVFLGSERYGGVMTVRDRGGRGVKNAWYYSPWWSIVPIRVRSRVAVRSKRRHGALALSSAARGFVTVARATLFDRAIAGGRVELDSTVTRAAFAGLFVLFENQMGEYRASNMART